MKQRNNTIFVLLDLGMVALISSMAMGMGDCQEPEYGWTVTIGGVEIDDVDDVALDAFGNLFITGDFRGTVDFDPTDGVDERTSPNATTDAFVTRINADGSYGWTRVFNGPDSGTAKGAATDPDGNVIVTGNLFGTVDFDPGEGVDERTSLGSADIFITKLGSDGSYGWTRTIGGVGGDHGHSAAIDSAGNIFVTGQFVGPVDFDPTAGQDIHTIGGGVFITAYTAEGSYLWTGSFGAELYETSEDICVAPDGSLLIVGRWGQDGTPPGYTIDFDPTEGVDKRSAPGGSDIWFMKLFGDGSYGWTRIIGSSGWESAYGIGADALGNVFVTGSFSGSSTEDPTLDFDPSAGEDVHTSNGSGDMFLTKLTIDGGYLWTKTVGGADYESGNDIDVGSGDSLVITGGFGDSSSGPPGYEVDFDPSEASDIHETLGRKDVFVTSFGLDGGYRWTRTMGGPEADHPRACSVDPFGHVLATGIFEDTADFDPDGEGDVHESNGSSDIFIAKYLCAASEDPCEGDANGDGVVDPLDSGFVLARFGCPVGTGDPQCDAADQNGDGAVDPLDSGFVLARFGTCP